MSDEEVRLIIWDLDETLWRGTLTEGGIQHVEENYEIVRELARRGIMSSICSKNDFESVRAILKERRVWNYFVFPSIDWTAKGPRIKRIVELMQLRPETILFIDDNPQNLNEAGHFVPGIRVSNERLVDTILNQPDFRGKDDRNLSRLHQYKVLERRKIDEINAADNHEFLRLSGIKVSIEYDVERNIDRAVELINRTNQLNFTKNRLPETQEKAQSVLRIQMGDHRCQSGLVHVVDKYGDYGFVGFFMVRNGILNLQRTRLSQELIHYCFSCRTLGMQVERWLYQHLNRPRIKVVGDVLTDLSDESAVDWIELARRDKVDERPGAKRFKEIRIHGGCEANSIAHYMRLQADKVVVTGNFHAGVSFVRVNSASLLLSACDRAGEEFRREAQILKVPYEMLISDYFDDASEHTVFVFGGQYDAPGPRRYRHKRAGWELRIEPHGLQSIDITTHSEDELRNIVSAMDISSEAKEEVLRIAIHICNNYESISFPSASGLAEYMHEIFERVPVGSKIVLILDDERVRMIGGEIKPAPWNTKYRKQVTDIASRYSYAGLAPFSDCIQNESEIKIGGNHYDRMVYHRMAEKIADLLMTLPAKSAGLYKSDFVIGKAVHSDESMRVG